MSSRDDDRPNEPRPKKQKTGGFKWKEKRSTDTDQAGERREEGLQRGYRDRSPRRDRRREEDTYRREEEEERPRDYERRDRDRERSPRRESNNGSRPSEPPFRSEESISQSAAEKFGLPASKSDKKDKPKKPPKMRAPAEPMIVVNVNDRLGTKKEIPCLASDSVKAFKALVAAYIGRQPHEIMLKRQGERPFKDHLTLEDYGVSSGVQLDLEISTGD